MTPEQVEAYHERGYVTLPAFFAEEEIRPLDDYLRANSDVKWDDKNKDPLREAHYREQRFFDFCTMPKLLDAVEQLIGPDIVLLYSHIINKKPGGLPVSWHQDGPYWPRVEPKVAVTAWVALDDADPGNGCMQVIPGSHKGNIDYGQRQVDKPDLIQDKALELPPEVVDESKAEDIILKRGDVSFHHSYIIHGSQPNHSDRRRAAYTIRYVPSSTKIQPRDDRKQYLVRGKPADNDNVYFQFGV
jgi:ectoine hydroxylase-related dioxygenase (phytanoyl-CoA dioxygenase family)